MKYIKTFENKDKILEDFSEKAKLDITYLAEKQGTGLEWSIGYVLKTINYFNLTEEQIHNLRLAVEYGYLYYRNYRDVINNIINLGYISSLDYWTERKFRIAFETNFKDKIIEIKKPYPICVQKFKGLKSINDLNSHKANEIIGEIPKEYPLDKKYVVGLGRYRGDNEDRKCLWENFINTKRESEFIKVFDEKEIYILSEKDIEDIEIVSQADKYNI